MTRVIMSAVKTEVSSEGLRCGRLYLRCITCPRMAEVMHRERMHGEIEASKRCKFGFALMECGGCERTRKS